jgi:hypothetical protein
MFWLVDAATRHTWTYGLPTDAIGRSIHGVLWRFFVDTGGLPATVQRDFDPKFLQGPVRGLLRSHGLRIVMVALSCPSANCMYTPL